MSAAIERIRRMARQRPQRLILAEGGDERAVRAAATLQRERLAEVSLGGALAETRETARRAGASLGGVTLLDAAAPAEIERPAGALDLGRALEAARRIGRATRATRSFRPRRGYARAWPTASWPEPRAPPRTCCAPRCG